ncbi:helix-turn-helix domain-containing protein [Nocardia cyriacigeorgica]|uniref:helix-turn-helix domain-containing protein n=1 Tax=Nocardia cyriacigeorgica TaxID=135487 RepID=UPI00245746B9|nr:helix-turn-helix transcriptional regulator [Nocardia cyriacigeorgica]
MGRKRNPIPDPLSPAGRFALELRRLLDRAPGLTLSKLAAKTNYSQSTLAEATAGKKLPTWEVAEAIVRACGAENTGPQPNRGPGPGAISSWRTFWYAARGEIDALSSVSVKKTLTGTDVGAEWRLPRPETVKTFDDLAHELRLLRTLAGSPSLRALHQRSSPYLERSQSTIAAIFTHARRPEFELLRALLMAMLPRALQLHARTAVDADPLWRYEDQWYAAWSRADFHHRYRSAEPRKRRRVSLPVEGLSPREAEEALAELPEETISVLMDVLERRRHSKCPPLPPRGDRASTADREGVQ